MGTAQISKTSFRTGMVIHWLVVLFMLFDAILKFLKPQPVIETTVKELGYKDHHILVHGFTGLIPTLTFIIPRTRILGAVLLTAHLGGAIASHLRIDSPIFSHTLFPVYVAVLLWLSIWLRDERFRNIFPIIKD